MDNEYNEFNENKPTAEEYQSAAERAARIYEQYQASQPEQTAKAEPEPEQGPIYGGYQSTFQGEMPHAEINEKTRKVKKSLKEKWNNSNMTKKVAEILIFALLFGTVAGGAFGVTNHYIKNYYGDQTVTLSTVSPVTGPRESGNGGSVADVVANAMPSVVAITNKGVTEIRTFFGTFQQESQSSGSGVIIGQNENELYIVTNYHVVAGSNQLTVVFDFDGSGENIDSAKTATAVIKGYDSTNDIAVIAVEMKDINKEILSGIRVATLGTSSDIVLGQQVVAIGNALGYGQSVTVGYISALSRTLTLQGSDGSVISGEYMQTDAAINPGNSGGALLNMNGELIGINSAKVEAVEAEAMGYAIPIDNAQPIIESILEHAERNKVDVADRGYLGISGQDVTSEAQETYGMPQGVYVGEVTEGAGAAEAGIVKGNIITKVDGYAIKGMTELKEKLAYYKHGETVEITIAELGMTGYQEHTVIVTLSNAKAAGITEEN